MEKVAVFPEAPKVSSLPVCDNLATVVICAGSTMLTVGALLPSSAPAANVPTTLPKVSTWVVGLMSTMVPAAVELPCVTRWPMVKPAELSTVTAVATNSAWLLMTEYVRVSP